MHCLWQWLYHSKIASYSRDANVPSGHVGKIFGTLKSAPVETRPIILLEVVQDMHHFPIAVLLVG